MKVVSVSTLAALAVFLAGFAGATDYTYTSGTGYWTNSAKWGGVNYPGQLSTADRAIFTNTAAATVTEDQPVTLSDVFFRNSASAVTLAITNNALVLTNSLQIGDTADSTGNVTLAASTGSLIITNASSTGQLIVGGAGKGTLTFSGCNVTVNQLLATNNTATSSNTSFTSIAAGATLTTTNTAGSVASRILLQNAQLTFSVYGTWNLNGGLNTVSNCAGHINNTFAVSGTMNVNKNAFLDMNLPYSYSQSGNGSSVTIDGGVVTNMGQATIGGSTTTRNTFTVKNGGIVYSPASMTFSGMGSGANTFTLDNGTFVSPFSMGVGLSSVAAGDGPGGGVGGGNTLNILNGGLLSLGSNLRFGGYSAANNYATTGNVATISGTNAAGAKATLQIASWLDIGTGSCASNNTFTIGAYGVVTGATTITVGGGATNAYNILIITNGGQLYGSGALAVGNSSTSVGDMLYVGQGCLLESGNQTVGAGNTLTNDGGIYQFTNATPTITPNGFGNIAINNGTMSFRNIDTANVTNNWRGSLTNILFSGTNAFRLNFATNTATLNQTYVFDPNLGPTNYARLEMVNGNTGYRGAAGSTLTIGTNLNSGGEMLCSNTTALVTAVFTNNGTLTLYNSTLRFTNNATFNGKLVIDSDHLASPNGVVLASNLTLGANSELLVTGHGTNAVLITYTNLLGGNLVFKNATAPWGYSIATPANGRVIIRKSTVTAIFFR